MTDPSVVAATPTAPALPGRLYLAALKCWQTRLAFNDLHSRRPLIVS